MAAFFSLRVSLIFELMSYIIASSLSSNSNESLLTPPFYSFDSTYIPYCPSGYSKSSVVCKLESKVVLDSLFIPENINSLIETWESSDNFASEKLPLTESRGLYSYSELLITSREKFSFGGFVSIQIWINGFKDGKVAGNSQISLKTKGPILKFNGKMMNYKDKSFKDVEINIGYKEGWNFIYLNIFQENNFETSITTIENITSFPDTIFFIQTGKIQLGGFKGFLYKIGIFNSNKNLRYPMPPECLIGEYILENLCISCSLELDYPDCKLFREKTSSKRNLISCYSFKSVACLETCPMGYSTDDNALTCKMNASSPYEILFHTPNTSYFKDSTGSITFASSYKLNAYQRGMFFNTTYGQLSGSSIQISPDFELFLFILPKSLSSGLLLSKKTSPSFSLKFLTQKLLLNLGSASITINSSYFTVNTWTYIFIKSESISSTEASISGSINSIEFSTTTINSLFIDVTSSLYFSHDSTYIGFLYQFVYAPDVGMLSISNYISTTCNQACSFCPASDSECLSTCELDQYFDSSLDCFDCKACEICIRSDSCSLNVDPLCKSYNKYDECEECKDFSNFDTNSVCQCIDGTSFDSKHEFCCSDLCSKCIDSEIFCQSCKNFSFLGLCLSDCPSLTSSTRFECEVADEDSMLKFKFEVTGNYVKDSSLDPIDDAFIKERSSKTLNPFLDGSDSYPGISRGLYIHEIRPKLENLLISPIHTWLIWTKITSYGSFFSKNGFYLVLNQESVQIGYNAATSEDLYSAFSVSLSIDTWYLFYLSANVNKNLTSIRFSYNKQSKGLFSPSPNQYITDKSSSLNLASSGFNGWVYRIDYLIYYLPNTETDDQYQIISSLSKCSFKQFLNESGDCKSCPDGCMTCINDESCLVCSDVLCYSCYDYDATDCTKCPDGQVFHENTKECGSCLEECKTCWRPRIDCCYECNEGFFMSVEGICVENCPSSYKVSSGKCVKRKDGDFILSFKFKRISDPVYDPIFNFPLNLGLSSVYQPESENEPLFLTFRGLYFRENAFASLGEDREFPYYLIVGNTHSVDMWIFIFSAGQIFLIFSPESELPYLEASIQFSDIYFIFRINYYVESVYKIADPVLIEADYSNIDLNRWLKVSIIYKIFSSDSVISLYINNQLEKTITASLFYLEQKSNSRLTLGNYNTESFRGYLYLFEVYSSTIELSKISKCSCPSCTQYGDCLIPCSNLEYWTGSECKSCDSECTLGCTRSENCVLHPDDLCEYFDVLEKGNCWGCVNLAEDTSNCKCVEYAEALSDYSECKCKENYNNGGNECTSCKQWIYEVNCFYSDSFESIIFEFDEPVRSQGLSCENIFSGSSISSFGVGYVCEFTNQNKTLIISLGSNTTFVYGSIDFNYKVLYSNVLNCSSTPSLLTGFLSSSGSEPQTKAILEYPDIVFYECENLIVHGSKSIGSVKRRMLYKWTVFSEPYNSKISEFSTDFIGNPMLIIPKENLFTSNISITLTVKNAFGAISNQTGIIESVIYSDRMLVYYDREISFYFLPNVDNYFDFFARKCEIVDSIDIKWKLVNLAQNTSVIDINSLWNAQKRNGQLLIPSNTFVPYTEVDFESYIDNNTNTILARSFISLVALPTYPQIFVDIANGTISANTTLNLNVSIYYEYNLEEIFDLNWTCTINSKECSIAFQDNSSLTILADELIPNNNLILNLIYKSRQKEGLSGSLRSVELNPVESPSPIVNIFEKVSRLQPQVINVDSPSLALESTISHSNSNFSYYWSCISDTPLELKDVRKSILIIDTQYLIPGSYYKLNLKLSSDEFEGSYFYEFTANIPPVVERLEITPKVGIEFSTIFKLQAINAYDKDFNYPLKYVFGFYLNSQQVMMNLKNQSLVYWTDLPYTTGILKVFIKAYDSLNSSSETNSVVYIAYDEKFDGQLYFEQMKKKFEFTFFDLQTTSGVLSLLSTGILNRDLYIHNKFSKNTVEKQKLIQECFEFCVQALVDMMEAIPSYDEQGITAISKAIELISLNQNLETLENTELFCPVKSQFLQQSSSISGINEQNFKYLVSACFNVAPLNDSLIFGNSQIFTDVIKLSNNAVVEHLKQVKKNELKKIYSKGQEYLINIVQPMADENLTLSSEIYGSKAEFSQELNQFLNGHNMHLSFLTIPQESSSNFYKNSEPTRQSVIDISLFIDFKYTAATTDKELLKIHIPVFNLSSELTPICIYLDTPSNKWSETGCEFISKTNSTVICSCSHLSSFSIKFLEAGGDTIKNTNIDKAFDYNLFNDMDSLNASGLYFFSAIIVTYLLLGFFVRKIDLSRSLSTENLRTSYIPSIYNEPNSTSREKEQIFSHGHNNTPIMTPKSDRSNENSPNNSIHEQSVIEVIEAIEVHEKPSKSENESPVPIKQKNRFLESLFKVVQRASKARL